MFFPVRLLIVHIFNSVLFFPIDKYFSHLFKVQRTQSTSNSRPHRFPNDMNSFGSMQFESLDRSGVDKQAGHDDPICRETQKKRVLIARKVHDLQFENCTLHNFYLPHINVMCNAMQSSRRIFLFMNVLVCE
jgi:hypothetical protein